MWRSLPLSYCQTLSQDVLRKRVRLALRSVLKLAARIRGSRDLPLHGRPESNRHSDGFGDHPPSQCGSSA